MSRGHLRERLVSNLTGLPLANAVVTVRLPGTGTATSVTLYRALTGGTPWANPLTTGTDGVIDFYVDAPDDFDLRVVAAGYPDTTIASVKAHYAQADLVDKTSVQTVSNKTLTNVALTAPAISSPTFSTPVLAPDGTISAPGLAFASEPGLGVRRVSASYGALTVNGRDVLRFKDDTFGPRVGMGNIGEPGATDGAGNIFHVHQEFTAPNNGVIGIMSQIANNATAPASGTYPASTPDSSAATFVFSQSTDTAVGAFRCLEVHGVRAYSGAGPGGNDSAMAMEVGIHVAATGNPSYTNEGVAPPKTMGIWCRNDQDALMQFLSHPAVRADTCFWAGGAGGFKAGYRYTDTDGTSLWYVNQDGGIASAGTHGFIGDLANGMYKITTNTLGLKTNATEAVRITSGQDVGIGGSPAAGTRLYVAGGLIEAAGGIKNSGGLTENGVIAPTALSGATNDWNPTGLSTAKVIRVSLGGVARNLTGIVAQARRRITFLNIDGANLTLKNNDAGSAVANRVFTPGGVDFVLVANGGCDLWYDDAVGSTCWRVASAAASTG